jgi:hypothetical protein
MSRPCLLGHAARCEGNYRDCPHLKSLTTYKYLMWGCIGPGYRYLGCYGDSGGAFLGRTLPQGLDGRTGVGVDECAAAARGRGFPTFALQGYGRCFFSSMADVARVRASQLYSDETCNELPCPASATTCRGYINKVYILLGTRIPLGPCPQ